MYLKQSFAYFKWVLQAILSLIVLSNCVSGNSNFDTAFSLTVPNLVVFFSFYWIGEVSKMCLK